MYNSKNSAIKIFVGGPGSVGKTCFISQFAKEGFIQDCSITFGIQVKLYKHTFYSAEGSSLDIFLDIIDCGGQDRFAGFRSTYASGSDGAFVIASKSEPGSLFNLPDW